MRAVLIEQLGGPEQLVTREVPDPEPGPRDVLIRVEAAGLNFIDTYHRTGLYPADLPLIPGLEGAGRVLAIGSEVDDVRPGDAVAWLWGAGSYAEKIAVPVDQVLRVPEEIDTSIAAAVALQGFTAHYLATDTFPLSEGDRCVVHAGAGGVGLLLTQIAKMRGAEVFSTVSTPEKERLSRAAGADHVILYTETDFQSEIEGIAGLNAIDVVYDGVGAATFMKGLDLLRPRGMMVTFGNASGPPPEIPPLILSQKGSLFLTRPTMGDYMQTKEERQGRVDDLFQWIAAGELQVRIGAEFPLEEAADAHRALEGRQTTGKVLIRPDGREDLRA